jgi:hypothetical protein
VGAKTFTLSFDGGRVAPYQIKERRSRFQGSLWLNMNGLKWLLGVIEQVRLKEEKKGFFQFLRSNYSILEVSCLTNRGGRFFEVVDYHSGAQRGNIRIPEGSRGIGWGKLATEIDSFFLGKDMKHLVSPEVAPVGGAPTRKVKPPNGKSDIPGSSRDSRTSIPLAPITPSAQVGNGFSNSNSQVIMDPEAPRPTKKSVFEWKPNSKTLRITKNIGEARKAHWATIKHKAVGLVQQPMIQKTQPEVSNPTELSPIEPIKPAETQASSLVVEDSSLDDTDVGVDSGDPMPPHGDSELAIVALQHRASDPFSDCAQTEGSVVNEGVHEGECDDLGHSTEMVRVNLADSESELGLPVIVRSPLDLSSDDAEIGVSRISEIENALQVVEFCPSKDPGCSSPLRCSPLAMMDPADCQVSIEVGVEMNSQVPSQWVKKHYSGFCCLVGFLMEEHEQQCLDLLQRIEADRFKYKSSKQKKKQYGGSVRKGSRELRNLVSSINYDGRTDGC